MVSTIIFSMSTQDIFYMFQALEQAKKAKQSDEVPIGAILVNQGQVISRAHNLREKLGDPTAHAEIVALREAGAKLGGWRLEGATLYVTVEPCFMCAGALISARIFRVVFGCRDAKVGALRSLYNLGQDQRLNHQLLIEEGILEDQCRLLMKEFFKSRR
ncbi:MAG TPA: tRNA adenosine(34) deaminase TadA [Bdellovibrionota bacterium]|nr:tRNA adenosine(34) deaminase TadA [Bdellovibrionota bacterium]